MPIPFREDSDTDHLGSAAFLRLVSTDAGAFFGALFLVNGRGEPVEFTYNTLEIVQRFLWRREDLRRHAARRLTSTLLEVCPRVPTVILCLAGEAPAELFTQDITVEIPTVRVSELSAVVGQSVDESREVVDGDVPLQVFWHGVVPDAANDARALVQLFAARGLLLEPFDRAATGLREVYGMPEAGDGLVEREPAA